MSVRPCFFASLLVAVAVCVAGLGSPAARGVEPDDLQQKQVAQEKARTLARELVSGILDVQLRQLEENRLTDLPVYHEIKTMRAHLDELVEDEMQQVVVLLVEAQQGDRAQRIERFQQARETMREVVVSLLAERQKLLKRLRIARLAAQTLRLIELQSVALDITQSLPEKTIAEREPLALTTTQDQQDITVLFFQLVATLEDVRGWGGPIADGAVEGLRVLATAQVEDELKQTVRELGSGSFDTAATSQTAVIRGLQAMLRVIEQTQGLIGADREAALKKVREALAEQQQLREQTREQPLADDTKKDEFAKRQHEIQQQIAELAELTSEFPTAEPLLDQARQAAEQAEVELFAGEKTEALLEQGRVIGNLAEIEARLQEAAEPNGPDQSAEELAAEVKQLEKLDETLDAAKQAQQQAEAASREKPQEASELEGKIAEQLAAANDLAEFSPRIQARLDDARDAVEAAAEKLAEAADDASPAAQAQREAAVDRAEEMLRQAAAEAKAELADTRRRQLAVEVGELARAAEALERASAAERDVAAAAKQAAEADGLSAEAAETLMKEQNDVARVAERIARGVEASAPDAARQLGEAKPQLEQTAQQLSEAAGEPGPQTKAAAAKSSESATQAAAQLEQAAAMLRKTAGERARQLAELAGQQLAPVESVREEVENALTQAETPTSATMQQLQQAAEKVAEARVEQLRADGRSEAAAAADLARQVRSAMEAQQQADRAAADVANRRSETPLEAARAQERVANEARRLAESSPAAIAQPLEQAAAAAAKAAKEQLVGEPQQAAAARQAAREALGKAAEAAMQAAQQAAAQPAGMPDAKAQRRVAELAEQARQLAGDASPAADALAEARSTADTATQAIEDGDPTAATEPQQQTAAALNDAAQQLDRAVAEMRAQQAAELAELRQRSGELAEQAAAVDAGATAALRQAEQQAAMAAQPPAQPQATVNANATPADAQPADAQPANAQPADTAPADLSQVAADARQGLQRAMAGLAARQQQLERDRDIAEAIAALAAEQQQARDQIAQQAAQLAEAPTTPDAAPSAEQMQAAQALDDAARRFADAQRATGEGAAEISGQQQVANQPVREGLQTASNLGRLQPPPPAPSSQTATAESADAAAPEAADLAEMEPATSLGQEFVPQSPEVTAERIAGEQALAEAAKMLAQANGQPNGQPGQSSTASSQQPTNATQAEQANPSANLASATTGGVAPPDPTATAEQQDDAGTQLNRTASGDSRTANSDEEALAAARGFQEQPWFAKLPPALQQAIRAKTRQQPPRGYEERLRRYFESVD